MDELAIIETNKLLGLVDAYLLTDNEINQLDKEGEAPISTCDYYDVAQKVLTARSKYNTTANNELDALAAFAALDNCALTLAPEIVPKVDIPIFGGSI